MIESLRDAVRRLTGLWGGVILMASLAACGSPAPTGDASLPPVSMNADLSAAVLNPADVADLFPGASYSVSQGLQADGVKGLLVTYPTEVQPHTSAFAAGFSTRIEVYADADKAAAMYNAAVEGQKHNTRLDIGALASASTAFKGAAISPEGWDLGKAEYLILVRRANAVITLTIRTGQSVAESRLSELARTVVDRLP
jgi:hypothetical protein